MCNLWFNSIKIWFATQSKSPSCFEYWGTLTFMCSFLASSYLFFLLFLMVLFMGTIYTAPEHHKFLSFNSSLPLYQAILLTYQNPKIAIKKLIKPLINLPSTMLNLRSTSSPNS